MRVLLRIAYDGSDFAEGFSRQPLPSDTVEGALLSALQRMRAAPDPSDRGSLHFAAASRTDKGVSALGNAVGLDTRLGCGELVRGLSALVPTVLITGAAEVPDGFDPRRSATARHYRYHLPGDRELAAALRAAGPVFIGTHDFGAFCRRDHRSTVRTVSRLRVGTQGRLVTIDIVGPSFLWNQVRRMVGAMMAASQGQLSTTSIEEALRSGKGPEGVKAPQAPAHALVLVGMRFPGVRLSLEPSTRALLQRRLVQRIADQDRALAQSLRLLRDVGGPVRKKAVPAAVCRRSDRRRPQTL